jgi:hypothetical protein
MNKFEAGDIVERINWSHGKTKIGERYTVSTSEGDKLTFREFVDNHHTYGYDNFRLVSKSSVIEQQIITAWLDKLAYVLNKDTTITDALNSEGDGGLVLFGDLADIRESADIYQYVENTYDQLKSQEIQKKSQKLLEQKEQLAKQLADIEKELESLK